MRPTHKTVDCWIRNIAKAQKKFETEEIFKDPKSLHKVLRSLFETSFLRNVSLIELRCAAFIEPFIGPNGKKVALLKGSGNPLVNFPDTKFRIYPSISKKIPFLIIEKNCGEKPLSKMERRIREHKCPRCYSLQYPCTEAKILHLFDNDFGSAFIWEKFISVPLSSIRAINLIETEGKTYGFPLYDLQIVT